MNIQEIDSTQIFNTLGLNSEIVSENELVVLNVLLDKIIIYFFNSIIVFVVFIVCIYCF